MNEPLGSNLLGSFTSLICAFNNINTSLYHLHILYTIDYCIQYTMLRSLQQVEIVFQQFRWLLNIFVQVLRSWHIVTNC